MITDILNIFPIIKCLNLDEKISMYVNHIFKLVNPILQIGITLQTNQTEN